MDILFSPRPQVVKHFAEMLAELERYSEAVQVLREHHTGVAMLDGALKMCRERLADPQAHPLELMATFHIAKQVHVNLHHDVMQVLRQARGAAAHD